MYDLNDLKIRVSKKRQRFIIYLAIALAILLGGILLIAFNPTETLFFIGIVVSLASLVYISGLVSSYSPTVLFSKEKRGENIKEHIYEVYVRRGVALRPKQVGMGYGGQPISHTRMAKAHLRSSVYLRLDSGSVTEIRGMRVEHVELYGDGDILLKHSGTKYPVIIGRESDRQPCPLCGAINLMSDDACINCDLKIEDKQ